MIKDGLRWHLYVRSDGCEDEYATSESDYKPLFLITRSSDGGWVLHQPLYVGTIEPINRELIEWSEVWEFDSQERAREHAEYLYRSRGRLSAEGL